MSKKEQTLRTLVKDIVAEVYPEHDFVQTSPCGRGERHPKGILGKLFRIKDPSTVRVGNCFLHGRLLEGDHFLCIAHSGDCFQTYMYVRKFGNGWEGKPSYTFGSYGIGDAEEVELPEGAFDTLRKGRVCLT